MKNIVIIIGMLFIVTAFIGCISNNQKGITPSEKQAIDKTKDVAPLKGQGIKAMRPKITGTWDDLKWQRCIEFHGHE